MLGLKGMDSRKSGEEEEEKEEYMKEEKQVKRSRKCCTYQSPLLGNE